jgi:DNA-binding NarL/FixJ family response regulator
MAQAPSRATLRVVIVADHPLTAEAIRRGLRHAPACEVIGYVDGRRSDLSPLTEAGPNVVLIDEAETLNGTITRVREVRAAAPEAKLILLASDMDSFWLTEAAAAGIDAALAKNVHLESLGLLVREVAVGNVFHAFDRRAEAPAGRNDRAAEGLTGRELEILCMVASGASNGRIARELWVTEQTVKFHLSNLYRKLDVSNRTEASHYAHVHGLVSQTVIAAERDLVAA